MLRSHAQENEPYTSPLRTPARVRGSPSKSAIGVSPGKASASPFKRAAESSRARRSAFTDKTNQSPAARPADASSPSKHTGKSPEKEGQLGGVAHRAAATPFPGSRIFSRQNSYVTPAANIGRAGQMKARMGELRDAQCLADPAPLSASPAPAPLPESQAYPDVGTVTPGVLPLDQPYDVSAVLDGLPRAADVAAILRGAPVVGFDEDGSSAHDLYVPGLPHDEWAYVRRRPPPSEGPRLARAAHLARIPPRKDAPRPAQPPRSHPRHDRARARDPRAQPPADALGTFAASRSARRPAGAAGFPL
ncbi:hypothetical protein MSPP1_003466 [Malassezia sp. CBS 17886]|nr:hypothetical protein MSPP1_003466 [Malassezia sp. CBS 17886]